MIFQDLRSTWSSIIFSSRSPSEGKKSMPVISSSLLTLKCVFLEGMMLTLIHRDEGNRLIGFTLGDHYHLKESIRDNHTFSTYLAIFVSPFHSEYGFGGRCWSGRNFRTLTAHSTSCLQLVPYDLYPIPSLSSPSLIACR